MHRGRLATITCKSSLSAASPHASARSRILILLICRHNPVGSSTCTKPSMLVVPLPELLHSNSQSSIQQAHHLAWAPFFSCSHPFDCTHSVKSTEKAPLYPLCQPALARKTTIPKWPRVLSLKPAAPASVASSMWTD